MHVKNCLCCQRNKPLRQKPYGLLHPLPIPTKPWQHISMDLIVELPKSKRGSTGILTVVDRFSKMSHFIPLKSDTTAQSIATLFFDNIVKLHGVPLSIVSDRDPRFMSNFWS
jgi:hypothetical protein